MLVYWELACDSDCYSDVVIVYSKSISYTRWIIIFVCFSVAIESKLPFLLYFKY